MRTPENDKDKDWQRTKEVYMEIFRSIIKYSVVFLPLLLLVWVILSGG